MAREEAEQARRSALQPAVERTLQPMLRRSAAGVGFVVALASSVVSAAFVAGDLVACGPSYQSIYESDARFEHCYALDDASDIPLTRKRDCWNDWRAHSTAGQSRDRVEYANARAAALTRAEVSPTDDSLMQAAPGGGTTNQVLAPEATNAFAPPPKTLESMDGGASMAIAQGPQQPQTGSSQSVARGGASDAGVVVIAATSPGASCASACAQSLQGCQSSCSGNKCTSCDAPYRKCMRGCFK